MKKITHKVTQLTRNGFSEWLYPEHKKYLMACCDCGLVHEMQFGIADIKRSKRKGYFSILKFTRSDANLKVGFRARRHISATKAQRKK